MTALLKKLQVHNFRTYQALSLDLPPGLSVFFGANGAGKTNLLEAVHVLAVGRSPRALREEELVRFGSPGYHLRGLALRSHADALVEVAYDRERGKTVRVNGHPSPALSALAGLLPVVFFAPDDLVLISGSPARRRSFLDHLLCQLEPSYAYHLDRYRDVLQQRNATLRDARLGRTSDALLPVWDEQLVLHGAALLASRLRLIEGLRPLLRDEYRALSGDEDVGLAYAPAAAAEAPPDPGATSAWLERLLAAVRPLERERGHTLVGPHRDDLLLTLGGLEARTFASQGQRRCLALALKLAAGRMMLSYLQMRPLLLLDDVFSELDAVRRQRLAERVAGEGQVLLTCSDPGSLKEITARKAEFFHVRKGEIVSA